MTQDAKNSSWPAGKSRDAAGPARTLAAASAIFATMLALSMLVATTSADAQRTPGEREPVQPFSEGRPAPRTPRDKGATGETSREKAPPAVKAEPKPIPSRLKRPGTTGVPEGGLERAQLLAELYAHLATAQDEAAAARIATAIEHIWRSSSSETVGLLMERSVRASKEKKHELAVRLLDRAVQLSPDNAEVFKTRAAVNYARDDMRATIGDLRRALALEPNDFKALEMLGGIFKELGRKKAAYEVHKRLYDVNPQMQGLKMQLDELERDAIGQPG
jgi:tetratricopeptide (TPR) repeat protein